MEKTTREMIKFGTKLYMILTMKNNRAILSLMNFVGTCVTNKKKTERWKLHKSKTENSSCAHRRGVVKRFLMIIKWKK